MDSPLVSAIIVNWNHGRFLGECLDALLVQDTPSLDATVVDNGSIDGSPERVARHYPDVRLLRFSDNRGFSRAFNRAVRRTAGAFVLSLNPDVTVRPGFISAMVQAAGRDARIGMVAPKLLRANDPAVLDSTCLCIDRRRRPYDRGQGEVDRGQYDGQPFGSAQGGPYVFGACGAAALYRRAMLDDLALDGEYFDEDFFAYCEDADLAWRAQLRGWRCVYAPRAVATHARGWGDTLRKRGHAAKNGRGPRLALRNRYLMAIKNDAWGYLLADVPLILAAELPRLAYAAVAAPQMLLGVLDLARAWPAALRKRRRIRRWRTVDDVDVRRWFLAPKHTMARSRC
jgi:GT2 family glycosyltransferase